MTPTPRPRRVSEVLFIARHRDREELRFTRDLVRGRLCFFLERWELGGDGWACYRRLLIYGPELLSLLRGLVQCVTLAAPLSGFDAARVATAEEMEMVMAKEIPR